jgi:hypothetical protein
LFLRPRPPLHQSEIGRDAVVIGSR